MTTEDKCPKRPKAVCNVITFRIMKLSVELLQIHVSRPSNKKLGLVPHKDKRYVCPDCKNVGMNESCHTLQITLTHDYSGMALTRKGFS